MEADSENWQSFLRCSLQSIEAQHRRRKRNVFDTQHRLINFGGNDYLGLRNHPAVIAAAESALHRFGVGSGASPLVSGYEAAHQELEQTLSELCNSDAVALFSSGFACHASVLACLAGENDLILSDQLNHASIIDGCRLSRAKCLVYPHLEVESVANTLKEHRHQFKRVLIVTESLFSMDGDLAPLVDLARLADKYACGLVVDEAHATGIYGERGGGLVEELKLQCNFLVKLGTLSKAIGCVGGFVAGEQCLIDFVINSARGYIFSTALPSCIAAAANCSVKQMMNMQEQRTALRGLATKARAELSCAGLRSSGTDSPILPIVLGTETAATVASEKLRLENFFVPAIRPPTVPPNTSRLRITVCATHSISQVSALLQAVIKHTQA